MNTAQGFAIAERLCPQIEDDCSESLERFLYKLAKPNFLYSVLLFWERIKCLFCLDSIISVTQL